MNQQLFYCIFVLRQWEKVSFSGMKTGLINIAKISVTSPIVINMPTRELLAGETKSPFV